MGKALLACISLVSGVVAAQTFEVASVKPTVRRPIRTDTGTVVPKPIINQSRAEFPYITLKALIATAYDVRWDLVFGPDWLDVLKYDVAGTLPPNSRLEQIPLMLRTLLQERFRLAVHDESRNLSVYEMVLAPGGLTVKPEESGTAERLMFAPLNSSQAKLLGKASLATLADRLSVFLNRPTLDLTHREGVFAFNVDFALDAVRGGEPSAAAAQDPAPTIFTALQKVGLRLEPRKRPIDVIVVDRADKVPVAN